MLVAIKQMMNEKDIDPKRLVSTLSERTPSLKIKAFEGHEDAKELLDAINALWDKAQDELGYIIRIDSEGAIKVSREDELIFEGQVKDSFAEIEEMMNADLQDIDYKTFGKKIGRILRQKTHSLKKKALDSNCEGHEDAKKLLDAINALWDKAQKDLGYTIRINSEGIIKVSHEEELIFQGKLDNE